MKAFMGSILLASFVQGMVAMSNSLKLDDLSLHHKKFAKQTKGMASADPNDGVCHEPIVGYTPDRLPALTSDGMTVSDCWIDRPNAKAILEYKFKNKVITLEERDDLEFFIDEGYMHLKNTGIDPSVYAHVDTFVHDIWSERPDDLLVQLAEYNSFIPTKLSEVPFSVVEGNGSKVMEGHAHHPALAKALFNEKVFRYMTLIYEEPPVATQSLFFRVGASVQTLHRDPWYVQTRPPGNMMASWLALEDIHHGSGELEYIPRSHRLPYTALDDTNDIVFSVASAQARKAHVHDMYAKVQEKGMSKKLFAPKKGEILIWHANLIHGGSVAHGPNAGKTRKSLVVHYDKLRKRGYGKGVHDGKKGRGTNKLMRYDCMYAFADPMLE